MTNVCFCFSLLQSLDIDHVRAVPTNTISLGSIKPNLKGIEFDSFVKNSTY